MNWDALNNSPDKPLNNRALRGQYPPGSTIKPFMALAGLDSGLRTADIMQAGSNAAMGYQRDGSTWKPYMRLGTNRGGGAIVSTIGDILATLSPSRLAARAGRGARERSRRRGLSRRI